MFTGVIYLAQDDDVDTDETHEASSQTSTTGFFKIDINAAAYVLLETSSSVDFTNRRLVTSTDDRGFYVTFGDVKPTLTVIPLLFKSGNTSVSAVIFVSISSFSSSEEYNNENPFDSSSLSLDNGFVFLGA